MKIKTDLTSLCEDVKNWTLEEKMDSWINLLLWIVNSYDELQATSDKWQIFNQILFLFIFVYFENFCVLPVLNNH